jgi:hypothetical protein
MDFSFVLQFKNRFLVIIEDIDVKLQILQLLELCVFSDGTGTTSSDTGTPSSDNVQVGAKAKPMEHAKVKKLLEKLFPDSVDTSSKIIHQSDICAQLKCRSFGKTDTLSKPNKKRECFKHCWLDELFCEKTGFYWLVYEENAGMFCLLCRKHNAANAQNRAVEYNTKAAVRCRRRAIADHATTDKHIEAVQSELTSRVSIFEQIYQEQEITHYKTVFNAFLAAYWLSKEEIPNSKFYKLLSFIKKAGVDHMKYFGYSSVGIAREIFLTLGDVIREQVVENVQQARCYGILTDEVCDIAVIEVLLTFIQYVKNGVVHTDFLSADDVLKDSKSANAETITNTLKGVLDELNIGVQKMSSFVSDGANVMVGIRNGVAARLRRDNQALINVHCVCHRLALACTDTCTRIKYIDKVHGWLVSLWKFFEGNGSAKRLAIYLDMQLKIRKLSIAAGDGERSRVLVQRRLKKACSTRWLSFDSSIKAVYQDYVPVLLALNEMAETDPKASGLLAEFRSPKFLGAVYILHIVLPILSQLSRSLQTGCIHYSALPGLIDRTIEKLQNVSVDDTIGTMKKDLDPSTGRLKLVTVCVSAAPQNQNADQTLPAARNDDQSLRSQLRAATGNGIALTAVVETQLQNLLADYTSALEENIHHRFGDGLSVINLFSIFDPLLLPEKGVPGFSTYGDNNISKLGKHFYPDEKTKQEQLVDEWRLFKHQMARWKPEYEESASSEEYTHTSTLWCLKRLLTLQSSLQFELLVYIAEVAMSAPISNAWPERGASAVKRIKTRLRSSMKMDMLDTLLHISINGPDMETQTPEADVVIGKAVKKFMSRKRTKIGRPTRVKGKKRLETRRIISLEDDQRELSASEVVTELGLDSCSSDSESELEELGPNSAIFDDNSDMSDDSDFYCKFSFDTTM